MMMALAWLILFSWPFYCRVTTYLDAQVILTNAQWKQRAAVDRNNLQDFVTCYCTFSFPKAQPPKRTKEAVLAIRVERAL